MKPFRSFSLIINAIFPFIYPARHYFNGHIFAGLFHYISTLIHYCKSVDYHRSEFPLLLRNTYPCLLDRYDNAGIPVKHYFWQDLWGARKVYASGASIHYDIGSRLDGFIAHILPFSEVIMLDIRPLPYQIENLKFLQTNCADMKEIPSNSIHSLSSFHAVEHFGLGRYGDPIDPLGYIKAISEIKRIMHECGNVYFSVPIGMQRLEFNAHRVFDPNYIVTLFDGFDMIEFSVIDDDDNFHPNAVIENYRNLDYGCGLFHFRKQLICH